MIIRQARKEDTHLLAPRLRKADLDEISASSGERPQLALLRGLHESEQCYSVLMHPEALPIAMFGIVRMSDNPSVGQVWLLGSDDIGFNSIGFLRRSKEWVELFQLQFPVLYNNIDARNTVHIKWLQWLGFQFINELPNYGNESRTFYHFVRIQTNV